MLVGQFSSSTIYVNNYNGDKLTPVKVNVKCLCLDLVIAAWIRVSIFIILLVKLVESSRWQNFLLLSWSLEIELDFAFLFLNYSLYSRPKRRKTIKTLIPPNVTRNFLIVSFTSAYSTNYSIPISPISEKMSRFDNGVRG